MANEEATRAQGEHEGEELDNAENQTSNLNQNTDNDPSVAAHGDADPVSDSGSAGDDAVTQRLAELEATIVEQKESVLRAQAEMQNVRRRAERDVENAHKFALDKFSADLLPVIDSLERALDAAESMESDSVKAMKDGVELTLKMFLDTLAKHGIEPLDPVGQPFDPEFHQAMSMVPNPEMEPNSVMAVMQKGYSLRGRLVRPAMVVVSKAP